MEQEPKEWYIWWSPMIEKIRNFRSTRIQLTGRTGGNYWTLPLGVRSTTEKSKTPQVTTERVWCLTIGCNIESGRSWHLLLCLTRRRVIFTPDAGGTLFSVWSLLCICSPPVNWPNAGIRVRCSVRSPFSANLQSSFALPFLNQVPTSKRHK